MDERLARWNDEMYLKHPTPYEGLAGRIERARVAAVVRLAAVRADDAVLEVGCGAGHVLVALPRCRRKVGLDISERSLADARVRAAERGERDVELAQFDANDPLPYAPGDFDVIICAEVLEHVPEPRRVAESIHAVATPATRVIFTVPNERPKLIVKRLLRAVGLMRLLFPGIEEGFSEGHLHCFSKKMLREVTRGLFAIRRLRSIWGCHFVALMAKRPDASPTPGGQG